MGFVDLCAPARSRILYGEVFINNDVAASGAGIFVTTSHPALHSQLTQHRSYPQSKSQWVASGSVLLITVALAVRLFQLTSRYAVNVFFFDQWDFNNGTL